MWAGLLMFLFFVFFAVQLLYGLYATSTITAIVDDTARRAAARGALDQASIERDLRRRLEAVDRDTLIEWRPDDCSDGEVELRVVVEPPRFAPAAISTLAGIGTVDRTARVRCEGVR